MNDPNSIKIRVKAVASSGPRMAMLVARLRLWVQGVLAIRHRLFRFPAVYFGPGVKLVGASRISIGRNSAIGARSWLNVNAQGSVKGALVVGENCFLGQDSFLTVGRSIRIGDCCLLARGCAFLGSAHIYSNPNVPYLLTGTTDDADIIVGANCFFGYGARVLGHIQIGHGSVIGAGAEVRHDIPPFSLVVGQPARVIKRYDFGRMEWVSWPTTDYLEGPPEDEFLKRLRADRQWFALPLAAAAGAFSDVS